MISARWAPYFAIENEINSPSMPICDLDHTDLSFRERERLLIAIRRFLKIGRSQATASEWQKIEASD